MLELNENKLKNSNNRINEKGDSQEKSFELIKKIQQGEKDYLKELAEVNKYLMLYAIKKFTFLIRKYKGYIDLEDLRSMAFEAMYISAQRYNLEKKAECKFSSYYLMVVSHHMCKFDRLNAKKIFDTVPLSTPIVKDNNSRGTLDEVIPCENSAKQFDDFENRESVEKLLKKAKTILREREYDILVRITLFDVGFKEIAKEQGVTVSRISDLYNKARKKLIKKLNKNEFV